MRHLKLFEKNIEYKQVLSDFGMTENDLNNLIDYVGRQYYDDVKSLEKEFLRLTEREFGYQDLSKIIELEKTFKKRDGQTRVKEDFFLDLVDDGKITFERTGDFELRVGRNIDQLVEYLIIVKEKIERHNLNISIQNILCGPDYIKISFKFG